MVKTKATTKKRTKSKEVLEAPEIARETSSAETLDDKGDRVDPVRDRPAKGAVAAAGGRPVSNGIEKYYESVGRRKEATARVRVYTKKSTDVQPSEDKAIITVNNKPYFEYFNSPSLQEVVDAPLRKLKSLNRFKATVKVLGGGPRGQADAIKFGLSRGLVLFDSNFAKKLRKAGFLTRDSREKERRKYGLKKARKSPQWAKR